MVTDEAASELYVADGYGNRRIIVFDARTGAYKRHWGAYGTKQPTDDKLPPYKPVAITELAKSFGNPVHCVRLSRDGLVYVCDRANDRIQIFRKEGTFVKEFQIELQTLQNGSVWDLALHSSSQMAPTCRCSPSIDRAGRGLVASVGRATWPATSSRCTILRSTAKARSIPPKSATAVVCRSSSGPIDAQPARTLIARRNMRGAKPAQTPHFL